MQNNVYSTKVLKESYLKKVIGILENKIGIDEYEKIYGLDVNNNIIISGESFTEKYRRFSFETEIEKNEYLDGYQRFSYIINEPLESSISLKSKWKDNFSNNIGYSKRVSKIPDKICNDKWDAQSDYKLGLSVIYKDGKYGLVNLDYEILLEPIYSYIEIKSENFVLVKDENNNKKLYKVGTGFIIDSITEEFNNITNINMITKDIFVLMSNNKFKLYINGKLEDEEHDYIYACNDMVFIEDNNKTSIYRIIDNKLKLLFKTSDNDFLISSKYLLFKGEYDNYEKIQNYNIIKIEDFTNKRYIYDENGKAIILTKNNIKKILNTYKFFYNEKDIITVFNDKRYGLSINMQGVESNIKWFNSEEDRNDYLLVLQDKIRKYLNYLLEIEPPQEEKVKKYIKK